MKINNLIKFILLFSFLAILTSGSQPSAKEIVRIMNERLKGKTSISESSIEIIRPKYSRTISLKSWSKGDDYTMMYLKTPVKDKGTTFLTRKKEVWNWIPSIERIIKLPPSMMSQSWMGTDFSNDDLVNQTSVVDDYSHTLIGKEVVSGLECYKIEMIPNESAAIVWGKVLVWVDVKDYMQLKVEFYDEDEEIVNKMLGKAPKMFGDVKLPSKMEMIPQDKRGHKTVMTTISLKFNQPLDDNFFTVQNMKRIKA